MTRYWFFIDNGDDTAREQSMEVGKYYWVLLKLARRDPEWQPARFTGIAGDSAGATWDYIGFNSDIGHHFVEVLEVGPEVADRTVHCV